MTRFARASVFISLVAFFLLGSAVSRAQVTTAVVNGTVRDPTGAAIPGATIELQNRDTGLTRTTVTNDSGTYVFTEIPPGVYSITVSRTGFATQHEENVTLAVSQNSIFDFTLRLGATQQSVTVEASAAALQTSSAGLGTVINTTSVNDLPLNGRNFTQLLTLTTGASPINVSQSSSGWRTNAVGEFTFPSLNGQTN